MPRAMPRTVLFRRLLRALQHARRAHVHAAGQPAPLPTPRRAGSAGDSFTRRGAWGRQGWPCARNHPPAGEPFTAGRGHTR
jgi:hypothetical protein